MNCSIRPFVFAALTLVSARILPAQNFTVVPAPEWDALFNRELGWTGADGIFSIPFDRQESPGGYLRTKTFLHFSDTFVGRVLADGSRHPQTALVNNTAAILSPGLPDPIRANFFFAQDGQGNPRTMFDPNTPNSNPFDFHWLKDGILIDQSIYILASRFRYHNPCLIQRAGVTLIEIPSGSQPPFENHLQTEVPLYVPAVACDGAIVFGSGIMSNTVSAGAPSADGYIYVYGTREDLNIKPKKLLVARVLESEFADTAKWKFFDGQNWVADIRMAVPIDDQVSMELSVTPLPNGQYALVAGPTGGWVFMKIADHPWGPFGPKIDLYRPPEPSYLPDVFAYNAKAHPHLSDIGELLVSYNVNTLNGDDNMRYADIYRPRFFRVIWQ